MPKLISDIRPAAICASFVLVYWTLLWEPTINLDGIIYIKTAALLSNGNWQGAYESYNWLFYPWLIAMLGKLGGMGLESAAHLLTAVFAAILTYAFITIIAETGGNRLTLLIAALVIVFHPELNEERYQVIKDHGYWALYLLSILTYLRYYKSPDWRNGILWGLLMAVATLFRIEGIVFLISLPLVGLVCLHWSWQKRLLFFLRANSFAFLLLTTIIIFYFLYPELFHKYRENFLERFSYYDFYSITTMLNNKSAILIKALLGKWADEYALYIILAIPLIIFSAQILKALTPIYVIILIIATRLSSRFPQPKYITPFIWICLLNLGLLAGFMFSSKHFFLQMRYVIPLMLVVLIWIPYILSSIYNKWQNENHKSLKKCWKYYILAFLLAANALEGIVYLPGHSKLYVKEAGLWLKENMPKQADLYTNNKKILYYCGHCSSNHKFKSALTQSDLVHLTTSQHNYLALWTKHGKSPEVNLISTTLGARPIKVFGNKRNDRVSIFYLE